MRRPRRHGGNLEISVGKVSSDKMPGRVDFVQPSFVSKILEGMRILYFVEVSRFPPHFSYQFSEVMDVLLKAKVSGERLVELTFINQSLMWLSTCIQALAKPESRKSMAVGASPTSALMSRFRNSKLTLLLSNALSGNSKTSMIGTLSPALANFEESTLADFFLSAKNSMA